MIPGTRRELPDRGVVMAEFYDLMNRDTFQARMRRLLDTLDASPTVGVLEIAAGTGAMTQVVTHRCPYLDVYAVEPSRAMGTAFFTTMAADPQMRARVRLLPMRAESVDLDRVVDLALCFNALHVFSPRRRAMAWSRVARALVPRGVLLVDRPAARESSPVRFDETELLRTVVAGGSVVLTYATEPVSAGRQRWLFRYRQLDEQGRTLQESINRTTSWRVGQDQLRAELGAVGFSIERTATDADGDVYVAVRR